MYVLRYAEKSVHQLLLVPRSCLLKEVWLVRSWAWTAKSISEAFQFSDDGTIQLPQPFHTGLEKLGPSSDRP